MVVNTHFFLLPMPIHKSMLFKFITKIKKNIIFAKKFAQEEIFIIVSKENEVNTFSKNIKTITIFVINFKRD